MPIQRPTSTEIVNSLKTLGFNITQEKDNHTTLSKGERTIRVPQVKIDEENERRLRNELGPIFSEHDKAERERPEDSQRSEDSHEALDRVRSWLREPNK